VPPREPLRTLERQPCHSSTSSGAQDLFVWYVRSGSCVFRAVRLRMRVCRSLVANTMCSDWAGTSRKSTQTHVAWLMRPASHKTCFIMHLERFMAHRLLCIRCCGEHNTGNMRHACSTRPTLRPPYTLQKAARLFYMLHTTCSTSPAPSNHVQKCYRAIALLSGRYTLHNCASQQGNVGSCAFESSHAYNIHQCTIGKLCWAPVVVSAELW
jgi:hypothetical protein